VRSQEKTGLQTNMHEIFTRKPWLASQAEIAGMPSGMLGTLEGALLYFLARDYFRGFGEMVDAGSFLGSSSYCLAKGLDENIAVKTKSGRLHAFDLFEIWLEQESTPTFMATELSRNFGISVADGESTLPIYMENLKALGRHIRVNRGDITKMNWNGRPIEILFLDICKNKKIWQHVIRVFYPSLIPGISIVIHQDYHHPLLPFIHVAQEFLADFFEVVDIKANDSTTFLLVNRIPERILNQACEYDFDFREEIKLMDRAIERFGDQAHHLEIAKCQLLRQNSQGKRARELLEKLKGNIEAIRIDPKIQTYIGFVDYLLFRDQAKIEQPPPGFDEEVYLDLNSDVADAVARGVFISGFNHWLQFGNVEGRKWEK
jgi:hypothetical protein